MEKFARISIISLVTLLLVGMGKANAEELVISGNGDGSQNTVTISTNTQTTVEQTNNANITNTVENNANTGDNSASSNTSGDVAITTGDVTSATSIENSGNVSVAQAGCCPSGDVSMTIEGNGANSENLIDATKENTTSITITQIANIVNNDTTNANTGGNSANSNTGGGSILIDTGTITISQQVENRFINLAHVSAAGTEGLWPGGRDVTIRIVNNGSSSENSIFPKWFSDLFLTVDNTINIANVLSTYANTGDNSANGNNGDVSITTGDIVIGVTLKNGPINESITDVSCCPKKEDGDGDGEQKPPVGGPPPPSGGGGNGGGGGGGGDRGRGGDVAAAVGAILPITGFNWFLATIANVLMFLFGLYLRRRSGRSPTLSFALA